MTRDGQTTQPPEQYQRQLSDLQRQIRRAALPQRKHLRSDLVAGLTTAIAAVPDGMASAVMAGLNPVQGLYACMIGTPVAATATSSVFMKVNTTSAMALATGAALVAVPTDQRLAAAVALTILIGIFQIAAGLAKLGFLTRYISNAVMTGFMSGIAVLIILGQLGDLTGLSFATQNKLLQLAELTLRLRQIDLATLFVGVGTIALVLAFERTRLRNFAMLLGLVLASLTVPALGLAGVELVGTSNSIPRSLPQFTMFDPAQVPGLLGSAVAVGIIGLVQGAGIAQAYPNPDGKFPNASRDFWAQGVANVAAGSFLGMPVGGSANATAVNIGAGARTRWSNIFSGAFLAVSVVALAGLIEQIPMAALAALLVLAGVRSIKPASILTVWQTSRLPAAIMGLTFVATLVLPVQYAVFLGVAVSFLTTVISTSEKVRVVEVVMRNNELPVERPAPPELPSDRITLLMPYGSLHFAAARMLEESLPAAENARRAVVILLLRGHSDIGSTFIGVLWRYAITLQENGGRLMLAGVDSHVYNQLEKTGTLGVLGADNIFPAGERLFEPGLKALRAARTWLATQQQAATLPQQEVSTES